MKTLYDWVMEARGASSAEAARCLRAAESRVEGASDWLTLASAWADHACSDDARRCVERAVASAATEPRTYRYAATLLARVLDDVPAARTLLDRYRDALEADPAPRASDWHHVAGGYAGLLQDLDAARRCLERGRSMAAAAEASGKWPAQAFDDLCELAGGYVEQLQDVATARALLEQATAIAEAATPEDVGHAYWKLANTHRYAFGDPEAARRQLARGLERASSVAGCLHVAAAVARDADAAALLRACVVQAEQRARSVDDWIEVAGGWHAHRGEPADIRRCLDQALAAAPDDAARARIAFGHRHWLGDDAAADRLSPRGVAPAALVAKHRQLEHWQAEPAALLDWLRARLTPDALAAIAAADYGSDVVTHRAALRDIQATGLIPQPLAWHPLEVLELTRWREGERVDHVARAFACTVLLLDAAGPTYRDGHEATMPVLIESCLALGAEAIARAESLFVVLVEAFEDQRVELGFAYLGLLMIAAARDPHDPRLAALAAPLIAIERTAYRLTDDPAWLLGATNFDARHGLWRSLAETLLAAPSRADPSLAHLAEIAERVRATMKP